MTDLMPQSSRNMGTVRCLFAYHKLYGAHPEHFSCDSTSQDVMSAAEFVKTRGPLIMLAYSCDVSGIEEVRARITEELVTGWLPELLQHGMWNLLQECEQWAADLLDKYELTGMRPPQHLFDLAEEPEEGGRDQDIVRFAGDRSLSKRLPTVRDRVGLGGVAT